MSSTELASSLPRKRARSPDAIDSNAMSLDTTPSANTPFSNPQPRDTESQSPPKRAKLAKKDEATYDSSAHLRATAGLALLNPMNRRAQKKEAKRARKAERKKIREEKVRVQFVLTPEDRKREKAKKAVAFKVKREEMEDGETSDEDMSISSSDDGNWWKDLQGDDLFDDDMTHNIVNTDRD